MNESQLESKFSNVYIMLLYSIMSEDMERVKHFISDDLYKYYESKVNSHKQNNEVQCYDELNVANICILKQEVIDNKMICEVEITSKYMDYIMDKDTGNVKLGNNQSRVQKKNLLVFEKESTDNTYGGEYECKNCGASVDVNFNGICPFCNKSIDLIGRDYILTSIKTY